MLLLTEREVAALLDIESALKVVERAELARGSGRAENRPRQRVSTAGTTLHVLPAAIGDHLGLKAYTTGTEGREFWLLLFGADGGLEAMMGAEAMGQMRTGAASGVATRHLSREDSRTVGIIGSGYQARTQLEAVCAVRSITNVKAWSRTRENLLRFCREMTAQLGIDVVPANDARAAVGNCDIVITVTSAAEPVLEGAWLAPGTHLNIAGSNRAENREVDDETIARANLIVVDDLEQARIESGDLIHAVNSGAFEWQRVAELGSVLTQGSCPREGEVDISLFKSHGVGLWDVALGAYVYEVASARQSGRTVDHVRE
jgi:alanine dehydrogenase